jgi:hypothetical protein
MQMTALIQIVQMTPMFWDMQSVLRRILQVIRVSSPETLLLTPAQMAANAQAQQPGAPPPDPARMAMAQARLQQVQLQHAGKMQELQQDAQDKQHEMGVKSQAAALESADRQADRQSRERQEAMKMQMEREKLAAGAGLGAPAQQPDPFAGHAIDQKAQAAAQQSQDKALDRQARMEEAVLRATVDREKMQTDLQKANQPPPLPAGGTATPAIP